MTLVLIVGLTLPTLVALLVRQRSLTRRANEGLAEWKRLYERTHHDQAALLGRYHELEKRNRDLTSRLGGTLEHTLARTSEPKTAPPPLAAATTPEPLTLVLPIQLLSKNARDKLHYRARHRLRRDYQDIIRVKYPRRGEPPRVRQRATVTRILGARERPFDLQNIGAGSAVELIDALTASGYWLDDAPGWLETEFKQGDHPTVKGPAVLVEISSL